MSAMRGVLLQWYAVSALMPLSRRPNNVPARPTFRPTLRAIVSQQAITSHSILCAPIQWDVTLCAAVTCPQRSIS